MPKCQWGSSASKMKTLAEVDLKFGHHENVPNLKTHGIGISNKGVRSRSYQYPARSEMAWKTGYLCSALLNMCSPSYTKQPLHFKYSNRSASSQHSLSKALPQFVSLLSAILSTTKPFEQQVSIRTAFHFLPSYFTYRFMSYIDTHLYHTLRSW